MRNLFYGGTTLTKPESTKQLPKQDEGLAPGEINYVLIELKKIYTDEEM